MSRPKLPDYLLERLAQGELPEAAARKAEEELARSGDGARRLEELKASDAELLAQHPPEAVACEIARRQSPKVVKLGRRRITWLAVPAAALAAVMIAIVVLNPQQPGQEVIFTKGDAALLVYVQREGRSVLLKQGDRVSAGEVVQLAFRPPEGWGVILSLDGAGQVTLHLPPREEQSMRFIGGKTIQLDSSYQLDAAPGFERFFLITSDSRFPTSLAVEAARKLAARGEAARDEPLPLPSNLAQTSFLLLKSPP